MPTIVVELTEDEAIRLANFCADSGHSEEVENKVGRGLYAMRLALLKAGYAPPEPQPPRPYPLARDRRPST